MSNPSRLENSSLIAALRGTTGIGRLAVFWSRNAGEISGRGSTIAEDAVLLEPDGDPIVGREAILADIAMNYDFTAFQQSATVEEVERIGDMAYAWGTWTLQPASEAAAGVASMSGKWSVIYKRGPDGGWQTWRWMWNQPTGQAVEAAATPE